MSEYTPLNIEQSVANYLSTQLQAEGYQVYWYDTEQTEGSGSVEVTLLRLFPRDTSVLVPQSSTKEPGKIRVPAISVFADTPAADEFDRMGLGESVFDWDASVVVQMYADTELQWYLFTNLFRDWFHLDNRIDVYNYQADINNASPPLLENHLSFKSTRVNRRELDYIGASRYFIFLSTTATFIE